MEGIGMDRQQATFGDLRGWMEALRREGRLLTEWGRRVRPADHYR